MLAQKTDSALTDAIVKDNPELSLKELTNIVTIMSCIEEKDMYLYYLSVALSKRLLDKDHNSINSIEWEKQLIHIIKSKLGTEFSKNLEAMVTEVEAGVEKKEHIVDHFNKNSNENLISEFHVNVLSNCEWMLPVPLELTPPTNIVLIQRIYEDMYLRDPTNLNKRLEWNYNLGSIKLKYNGQKGEWNFIRCKPYQYFVLELFQRGDRLTLTQISQQVGHSDIATLTKIMESLTTSPKILVFDEDSKTYFLNPNFDFKAQKTKDLREARFDDKMKPKCNVDTERSTAIRGCVMRVLKSNKIMEYSEVIRNTERLLLRFNPTSKAIRKEIDDLMKSDYIERDPENFNRLRYIA